MGSEDAERSHALARPQCQRVAADPAALDALRRERRGGDRRRGSPAEINLHDSDIVNMRVAPPRRRLPAGHRHRPRRRLCPPLYGTWALLPEDERKLIKGFVLQQIPG